MIWMYYMAMVAVIIIMGLWMRNLENRIKRLEDEGKPKPEYFEGEVPDKFFLDCDND